MSGTAAVLPVQITTACRAAKERSWSAVVAIAASEHPYGRNRAVDGLAGALDAARIGDGNHRTQQ
jgi:hypothetical protein